MSDELIDAAEVVCSTLIGCGILPKTARVLSKGTGNSYKLCLVWMLLNLLFGLNNHGFPELVEKNIVIKMKCIMHI